MVDTKEERQEVVGFGGAFTDAATLNFYKLPGDVQEKVCAGVWFVRRGWCVGARSGRMVHALCREIVFGSSPGETPMATRPLAESLGKAPASSGLWPTTK